MFHQVLDKQTLKFDNLSITYKSFDTLIQSSINEGCNFISIRDIENENHLNSKSIALTFDDGFVCIYNFLAPYLIDKCIPFAIFIVTDLINKPRYLNYDQLKALSRSTLCTLGAHSVSHPLLRKLNAEDSKSEIVDSKKILNNLFSVDIDYFAYPYGSVYAVSYRDIINVKEAGYKLAFSSVNGCLSTKSCKRKWFLPRINVNELNYYKLKL